MRKKLITIVCMLVLFSMVLSGCGKQDESSDNSSSATAESESAMINNSDETAKLGADELVVHFGDEGDSFIMHMEDNETAAAIADYVGTSDWRLPIYNYDESNVMQYYDIPSRYDIPAKPVTVTSAAAGDVYYSEPNRIVLYYHDAKITEEYVKIGTFEATEEFISAVEDNPVLEGWDNKIVVITDGD